MTKNGASPSAEFTTNYVIGLNSATDLELLHSECRKNFKHYDIDLINHAFKVCLAGHKNQIRLSGKPYYTHPLEVARIIVNELPLDDISVAAALLHDVCDNSDITIDDIRNEFGSEIATFVEGISQIQLIESYEIKDIDNYRKLILSWFKDIRVILIKLADRLHNLRTIEFLPKPRQLKIATETMDIYAPFAHRFGLGNFKWELEDIAFRIINPTEYNKINNTIQLTREEREQYIEAFIEPITARLDSNFVLKTSGATYEVFGRAKHIYSIYNKTILRQKPIEELFDLFAVRIIVNSSDISSCYVVLGIISDIFRIIPGTFKDYIASPKTNGYRSIHVAVIGMDNRPVEVQIRTKEMHDYAESGMAAHFKYKPGKVGNKSILDSDNIEEWVESVRSIFEQRADLTPETPIEQPSNDNLLNDITIFTHTSECRSLPLDSTPLDFAYSIHTEIGNTCVGAKVNRKIVPLDYKLKNGDQIEILNSKNQKPDKKWLQFVVTQRAKHAITQFIKNEQKKYLSIGVDMWISMQNDFDVVLTDDDFKELVRKLKYKSQDEFFVELGKHNVDFNYIHDKFYKKISQEKRNNGDNLMPAPPALQQLNGKIKIIFSECCLPIPDDRIVGEIERENEIHIHRRSCKQIAHKLNPIQENIRNLEWNWLKQTEFTTKYRLTVETNDNLMANISAVLMQFDGIRIKGIIFNEEKNSFDCIITLVFKSIDTLNKFLDSLKEINGVTQISRIEG